MRSQSLFGGAWWRDQLELGRISGAAPLRPMEGLRGVAVLLVFLVHYATLVVPWVAHGMARAFWDAVHAVGNVGVDLFFVLSGFLIYGGLVTARKPFSDYLWRRVRRIYPAFLAVFALYLVLSLVLGQAHKLPAEFGPAAVYVLQNLLLLPGLLPIEPLITVAWSLSYEFFFYLVTPAMVALLRLRDRSREWRIGFVALASIVLLLGFGLWGGPVRLTMFFAGMLLHELLGADKPVRLSAAIGALAGVLAFAVPLLAMPGPALQAVRVALVYLGFLGLCLAALQRTDNVLGRFLSWTPLRWMGNISYSYYLLHGLALQAFFTVVQRLSPPGAEGLGLVWLMPACLATLPPCLALFLLVERPLSLSRAPRPAASAAVAVQP